MTSPPGMQEWLEAVVSMERVNMQAPTVVGLYTRAQNKQRLRDVQKFCFYSPFGD